MKFRSLYEKLIWRPFLIKIKGKTYKIIPINKISFAYSKNNERWRIGHIGLFHKTNKVILYDKFPLQLEEMRNFL